MKKKINTPFGKLQVNKIGKKIKIYFISIDTSNMKTGDAFFVVSLFPC